MFLNFLKAEFPQPEENPDLTHHVERIWSLYITGILKKMYVRVFKKEQNSVCCSLAHDTNE